MNFKTKYQCSSELQLCQKRTHIDILNYLYFPNSDIFLEIRLVKSMEKPLNLQLNYGSHQSYMELRLVQMRDTLTAPTLSAMKSKGTHRGGRTGRGAGEIDSDETLSDGSNPNDVVPKEEGTPK